MTEPYRGRTARGATIVALAALLLSSAPASAQQLPVPDTGHIATLGYFIGSWNCSGYFPASRRKITSAIRFNSDVEATVLVKHHDDTLQPALYHAIEVWAYSPHQKQFVTTITDNFGGTRTFTSSGWNGPALVWSRTVPPASSEQFVYTKLDAERFRLDYRVSRNGVPAATVDTLTCMKAG